MFCHSSQAGWLAVINYSVIFSNSSCSVARVVRCILGTDTLCRGLKPGASCDWDAETNMRISHVKKLSHINCLVLTRVWNVCMNTIMGSGLVTRTDMVY